MIVLDQARLERDALGKQLPIAERSLDLAEGDQPRLPVRGERDSGMATEQNLEAPNRLPAHRGHDARLMGVAPADGTSRSVDA